jgi:hypothetical protein
MRISLQDEGRLKLAIDAAFSWFELGTFLRERMSRKIDNLASPNLPGDARTSAVVAFFNQRELIPHLMSALIAEHPTVSEFQQLADEWGMRPAVYESTPANELSASKLQKLVNSDPLLDVNKLLQGIIDTKRCVCRIKVSNGNGGNLWGTGFLVGEDLLLTNYHVMEPVIKKPSLASKVICKFDYEVSGDGKTINPGIDIGLANENEAVVAYSPTCPFDIKGSETVDVEWPADCFDYALIKLSDKIGLKPWGFNADKASLKDETQRGWIKRSNNPPELKKGGNIIILQHPDKLPMKIAIGLREIVGTDKNERRVRYTVNTMAGSSGAPCFDAGFNWIGMHNMGDENFIDKYNQGIPAVRILEDLNDNKKITIAI